MADYENRLCATNAPFRMVLGPLESALNTPKWSKSDKLLSSKTRKTSRFTLEKLSGKVGNTIGKRILMCLPHCAIMTYDQFRPRIGAFSRPKNSP